MTNHMHKITIKRLINAPRTKIFAAFSTAQALTKWYTPSTNISVEVLAFKFKVGEQYRFQYTMTNGSQPVLGGVYEIISPQKEIAFTWVWEAPDVHADIPTRVNIKFLEQNGSTELILTHEQLPSTEAGKRHADGWENTLDQLEREVEKGD
ncbi:MAG: SRPBCC domain-containing protein [Emcibacter sp.]|nr:SRPBCC domain-containing protein [Emcibacter sp.]